MQPTVAEIARTLASGRSDAAVHVACRPGPLPIRHATDCVGRPLLLVRTGDAVDTALRPRAGTTAVAVAVSAVDGPPVAGAPDLGRVWVSGWASRLDDETLRRAAAVEFAETKPVHDLLDLGAGLALYQVEVSEVRLEDAGGLRSVDVDEYTAADPDPLYPLETELLDDLADHHGAQVRPYLTRCLRELGVSTVAGRIPQAVRVDRYGLLVAPDTRIRPAGHRPDLGERFVRLPFPRPMRDRLDLAHLLHPVLFPHDCRHNHRH